MMFQPATSLTFENAKATLDAGMQAIAAGQAEIDFAGVLTVDSAAVASLLAWQRAARSRSLPLTFKNLPASLCNLISLYDVTTLINIASARSDLPHH